MTYPTVEEVLATARDLGRATTYGRSTEGRDLVAVEVGEGDPLVMVTAGIHGIELIGVQVALEVLRLGPIPGVRLLVCPLLNPDGYAQSQSGSPRRTNARGVDLNRNFPMPYAARPSALSFLGAGSNRAGDATWRGPAPLSEAETHALASLVRDRRPHASANLHSFLGVLFAARVWHPQDWLAYGRLARAFRSGQGTAIGYPRVGTPVGDVFTGELEDWQHHAMRCWAVCVECFTLVESLAQGPAPLMERFNPRDPQRVVARDAGGVREMLREAASLPRPPERRGASDTRDAW
jgi:predicted deacylase